MCSSIRTISAARVQYAHVPDLAKLNPQRPHTARWSSFLCSGACIRWYGTQADGQKQTGIDHGRYRFKKVTKIIEKRAQMSKSNVRTNVTVRKRLRCIPNPLGESYIKSLRCQKNI